MENEIRRCEIVLRELMPQDVTSESGYVSWLNDPETNKYLESRYIARTPDSVRDSVRTMLDRKNEQLFGIFMHGVHVGNIKIGSIDWRYKRADIGLVIA